MTNLPAQPTTGSLPHPPSGGRLVAAFTPTLDELADGVRSLLLSDLDYRDQCRLNRLGPWLLWSIALVILGMVILASPTILAKAIGYPGPALTFIAWLLLAYPFYGWVMSARVDTWINAKAGGLGWRIARKKFWSHGRPTQVTITDEGIRVATDRFQEHLNWCAIARCERRGDSIVISPARLTGYFIPVRAFADEAAVSSFLVEVEERQRARGTHPDDQVTAAAAESTARCPKCRYSLRGITRARCPECGLSLDAELFLRPAALAKATSSAGIASPDSPASRTS